MNRAASEQRKAAAIPRSFSFAKPRRGVRFWISSNRSGVFKFVFASILNNLGLIEPSVRHG